MIDSGLFSSAYTLNIPAECQNLDANQDRQVMPVFGRKYMYLQMLSAIEFKKKLLEGVGHAL